MNGFLLDTNIVSYLVQDHESVRWHFERYLSQGVLIYVSAITHYEIMNGLYFRDRRRKLARYQELLDDLSIISADRSITERAAQYRADLLRQGTSVGHFDLLIAATAEQNDLTLVTNDGDFSRIAGLRLENWLG